ncbi:MAG: hypothetical protein IRZ02_06360 [Acidothermus sp.]|nr:hypothetical protein [Acidothermus sp.]MCL6537067.1 hypothetical protein [Acidothermus sp.]
MSVTDHREIVAALRELPGVADAEVQPDAAGEGLGVLRLGLQPGVDEVEVASAVGRLLRERFGLGVDADRVQLVEDMEATEEVNVGPEIPEQAPDGTRFRPAIRRMHIVSSGLSVSADVTLAVGDRTAVGHSDGTATRSGVQRAVATATLRAVEELLGGQARFELDLVEVASTGRDRTVLVAVTMLTGSGSERLTGAAAVREDVRQAAIRATLDALNRRVEHLVG